MATIHDFARICNYHEHCNGCPFNFEETDCGNYLTEHPDNSTRIIDKWIVEHPIETYASNFYNKFPNAQKNSEGYPKMCLRDVYGNCSCIRVETQNMYGDCCKECWNREYKGE